LSPWGKGMARAKKVELSRADELAMQEAFLAERGATVLPAFTEVDVAKRLLGVGRRYGGKWRSRSAAKSGRSR